MSESKTTKKEKETTPRKTRKADPKTAFRREMRKRYAALCLLRHETVTEKEESLFVEGGEIAYAMMAGNTTSK